MMLLFATPAAASAAPATRPATRSLGLDLDPIVPLVDFRATTLTKAIDALRDQTGVNIVVRWPALKATGIEPDAPVDLRVRNLPLQRVLELLGEVSGAAGASGVPLAARADRGVVILSTRDELENETAVRIYDVRDLVESDMAMRSGVRSSAAAPTTGPDQSTPEDRYIESLEELTYLIKDTTDPESWRDAGGTIGAIHDFNGLLVITQTPVNHERIRKLLDELRRKK
jgi:hypothetical protein